MDGLESRLEMALFGFSAQASPSVLLPTGRYAVVTVTGSVSETETKLIPSGTFQVVDEYSQVEPAGHLTLRKSGDLSYDFSFTVRLKASVAASDTPGRQYYIVVAAREAADDSESSTGKVLPILVPNPSVLRPPLARQHAPRPAGPRMPGQARAAGPRG